MSGRQKQDIQTMSETQMQDVRMDELKTKAGYTDG
jgi:hypothetical protein